MRIALILSAATLLFSSTAQLAIPAKENIPAPLTAARRRIETSDFRATGRLIRTGADGNQISVPIKIEAHWFPGVLRELVELAPARKLGGEQAAEARARILFEMRPGGHSTIRVFHPQEPEPDPLPFEKWSESIAGSDFTFEDFLDAEYYWRGQVLLKSMTLGTRDCDVLKSTPVRPDRSHYAEIETWFDHATSYPLYVEKLPKDEGGTKEFTSLGLSTSGGVSYARQIEVKIHGRPGSTVLLLERGSAKANLNLKDFSAAQIGRFKDGF